MRRVIYCFVSGLIYLSMSFAQKTTTITRTYTVGGEKLSFEIKVFQPPIVVRDDSSMMDQATALHTSLYFRYLLREGKIEQAAGMTNDSAKVKERYATLRKQVGEEEFRQMFASYFSGGVQAKYRFTLGKNQMLIIHADEMGVDMSQFYIEQEKRFMIDEKKDHNTDALGRLFQQLKNEQGEVVVK